MSSSQPSTSTRKLTYWDRSDCAKCGYTSLTNQVVYKRSWWKGGGELCEGCATGIQHSYLTGIPYRCHSAESIEAEGRHETDKEISPAAENHLDAANAATMGMGEAGVPTRNVGE